MKIASEQIVGTEDVTTADGRTYRRQRVRLTPEQRAHFRKAAAEADRNKPYIPKFRVKAVFRESEADVLTAIDKYREQHDLPNRGAVLRVALAQLLGIEIEIPHHGWQAGKPRKTRSKRAKKAS